MKSLNRWLLLVLCFVMSGAAFAEDAWPLPDNAAVWYLTAVAMNAERFGDEDWELLEKFDSIPTDRATKFLVGCGDELAFFRRGSACEKAVWPVTIEEDGPRALLPHLGQLRTLMRMAGLSGRWHLDHGDPRTAVDEWLAVVRMSRHAADDGTSIGALVQFSIESNTIDLLVGNLHRLDRETLQVLREGWEKLPPRRTLADAVTAEKWAVSWFERHLDEMEFDEGVKQMRKILGEPDWAAQAIAQSDNPRAMAKKWFQDTERWMGRLSQALSGPLTERPEALEDYRKAVAESGNLIAQTFSDPIAGGAAISEADCRVKADMFMAAITWSLDGQLDSATDPATGQPFTHRKVGKQLIIESSSLGRNGEPRALAMTVNE